VLCVVCALVAAMFVWIHAPWGFRCGACGRIGELNCKGFSIAGEGIVTEAHCKFCGEAMQVDDAGYIVTRWGLIRTTVPVRAPIKTPEHDFLEEARREVDAIAPEAP
jgi:hypothetical protein